MSDNLNFNRIAQHQNNKYLTWNGFLAAADSILTETVSVSVTSTNSATVSEETYLSGCVFTITPDGGDPATASITITVPSTKRPRFAVINDTLYEVTVKVSGQTDNLRAIEAGSSCHYICDGSSVFPLQGILATSGLGLPWLKDFNTTISSTQPDIEIALPSGNLAYHIIGWLKPVSAGADLELVFSSDNGSSYDTTSGNYSSLHLPKEDDGTSGSITTSDTSILVSKDIENIGAEKVAFELEIVSYAEQKYTEVTGRAWYVSNTGSLGSTVLFGGVHKQVTAQNKLKLFCSMGNIDSAKLIGMAQEFTITIDTDPFFDDVYFLDNFGAILADESSNFVTYTEVGTPVLSSDQQKFSGVDTLYLDGSSAIHIDGSATDLTFSTTFDLVIEGWFYCTSLASDNTIFGKRDASSAEEGDLLLATSGTLALRLYSGGSTIATLSSDSTLSINTWYHYAVVRNGEVWSLYIDGVKQSTTYDQAASGAPSSNGQPLYFGDNRFNTSRRFTGYLGPQRITKNVSRYSGASFTVPDDIYTTLYDIPLTVENGGFETGDTTSWDLYHNALPSIETSAVSGAVTPRTGTYFSMAVGGSSSNAPSWWGQTIDISSAYYDNIDTGTYKAVVTAYHAGFNGDTDMGAVMVEVLDASNNFLASAQGDLTTHNESWESLTISVPIPSGGRKVVVSTRNKKDTSGTNNDSYWDDIFVDLVKQQNTYTEVIYDENDYTAWTNVTGTIVTSSGGAFKFGEDMLYWSSDASAEAYIQENITSALHSDIDAGSATFELRHIQEVINGDDTSRMYVEFYDGSDIQVGSTVYSNATEEMVGEWPVMRLTTGSVPTGARKARVGIEATRVDGTVLDAGTSRVSLFILT